MNYVVDMSEQEVAEPTYNGGVTTVELTAPESVSVDSDIAVAAGRTISFRYLIRGVRGRNIRCNLNWDAIRSRQAVVQITAGQAVPAPESSVTGPDGGIVRQNWAYHLGAAPVWVSNISPHFSPGGVEFLLQVEWGDPLDIGVTVTVEPETPFAIQGF